MSPCPLVNLKTQINLHEKNISKHRPPHHAGPYRPHRVLGHPPPPGGAGDRHQERAVEPGSASQPEFTLTQSIRANALILATYDERIARATFPRVADLLRYERARWQEFIRQMLEEAWAMDN